jgi:hypothetical protein
MSNKNYKEMGKLWNNKSIEVIQKDGRNFALVNYNGDEYLDCFELDKNLIDVINEDKAFIIRPIYKEIKDDEFELIDYEIVE